MMRQIIIVIIIYTNNNVEAKIKLMPNLKNIQKTFIKRCVNESINKSDILKLNTNTNLTVNCIINYENNKVINKLCLNNVIGFNDYVNLRNKCIHNMQSNYGLSIIIAILFWIIVPICFFK